MNIRNEACGSVGRRARTFLLLALTFLSAGISVANVASAQVTVQPVCGIDAFGPASSVVMVSPSMQGDQTLSGTLKASKAPAGVMTVSLTVTVSAPWTVTISPSTVTIAGPSGEQAFAVAITIPQATPTSQIGKIAVSAIGRYAGQTATCGAEAQVKVQQYYRLTPSSRQAYLPINPGSGALLKLDLYNRGNGLDTFSARIQDKNLGDLQKEKWIVSLTTPSVDNVPADEFATISIAVQSPRPMITYDQGSPRVIIVDITSENSGLTGEVPVRKSFVYTIFQKGFYVPGFDPVLVVFAMVLIALVAKRADAAAKRQRRTRSP